MNLLSVAFERKKILEKLKPALVGFEPKIFRCLVQHFDYSGAEPCGVAF